MEWYTGVLKKYAVFEGRARRKEYWYFFLINLIISIVLAVVDRITGTAGEMTGVGLLGGLYSLAILIPSLAVTVRRLHDTDRSGWWIFIALIPILGGIALLVFTLLEGTPGMNRFGPNPKAAEGLVMG